MHLDDNEVIFKDGTYKWVDFKHEVFMKIIEIYNREMGDEK